MCLDDGERKLWVPEKGSLKVEPNRLLPRDQSYALCDESGKIVRQACQKAWPKAGPQFVRLTMRYRFP